MQEPEADTIMMVAGEASGELYGARLAEALLQARPSLSIFGMGGKHIQFNVVGRETLLDAQKHPEDYRDLVIRVAGYSAYFVQLSKSMQDEIIARVEHQLG